VSTIAAGILACRDAAAPAPYGRGIRARRPLGMTGKAPGAPCKRRRAGSIPAFSTVGSEGDGNPPGLGPGQTRFDSGVPDHAPLAQQAEHLVEAQGMQVRFLRGAPCLTSIAVMRRSSKLVSGVQLPGEALRSGS
jgi:hypothetical protein